MYKPHHHLQQYEQEVQADADNECPVYMRKYNGMMMIVGMGMFHIIIR